MVADSFTTRLLPSLGLKTRMVLLVLVLLVAGVWGLALRVTAVLHSDLQKMLEQHLTASVGYVAADLDRDIRLQIDALNRIAASITPEILADPAKLQPALEQGTASSVLFPLGYFIVDRHGIVIAGNPRPASPARGSVQDLAYFRQLMAGGQPVIGGLMSADSAMQQPAVPIAIPLRDRSGATAGALVGLVPLSDPIMVGQLEHTRLGEAGYFLVVSPRDRLIVSAPEPNRIMRPLPPKGANPLLDRRLEEGFEGASITRNEHGVEMLCVSRRMATTGWIVLGGVPAEEAFAPITALKHQIYLTALLISLLIVAVLRFVLGREFARLDRAGEAMRRMTEGEVPLAPIPITRQDEIGKLIANFNRLATERGRLDEALRGEIIERKQAQQALAAALMRLQALSERLTQAQEDERRKVAYELHEQSGQELSSLMMHLNILRAHFGGKKAQAQLDQANTIARLALERVRGMSSDLHPPQLETFGLSAALRAHCTQQAAAAGWVLHFDSPQSDRRPPRHLELACFRMAQEALANVTQHASATQVWVSLRDSAAGVELRVRDDGIGFDAGDIHRFIGGHSPEPNAVQPAAGQAEARAGVQPEHRKFGLLEMEERVRQVGGSLEIKSSPGNGTEIHAVFPSPPPHGRADVDGRSVATRSGNRDDVSTSAETN